MWTSFRREPSPQSGDELARLVVIITAQIQCSFLIWIKTDADALALGHQSASGYRGEARGDACGARKVASARFAPHAR
jgi:hypothetical protein